MQIVFQSGKIAHELEYVNHHVRTKLDEIKRRELERLRHLAIKQVNPDDSNNNEIKSIYLFRHLSSYRSTN